MSFWREGLVHSCHLCQQFIYEGLTTIQEEGTIYFRHEQCPSSEEEQQLTAQHMQPWWPQEEETVGYEW